MEASYSYGAKCIPAGIATFENYIGLQRPRRRPATGRARIWADSAVWCNGREALCISLCNGDLLRVSAHSERVPRLPRIADAPRTQARWILVPRLCIFGIARTQDEESR